jgi:hypothetical protein
MIVEAERGEFEAARTGDAVALERLCKIASPMALYVCSYPLTLVKELDSGAGRS